MAACAHLHEEPVEAVLPQGLGLGVAQQAAAEVVAHVVQVGVHGVGAPAEVQVVGEVHHRRILEIAGHLHTEK